METLVRLSVATWNMDNWKRNQIQRDAAWNFLLNTLEPDIALLQECVPNAECEKRYNLLYREIGGSRRWGSAIITRSLPIHEVEFNNTYPGAVVAADVTLPSGLLLTVVSLYGVIDEDGYATTTLHRILSDLTPLLNGRKGRSCLLIGGDYNVSTQWDDHYGHRYPSHRILFERLEDFDLVNCTAKFHSGHLQTIRHPKSSIPWQNDYIHVSKKLAERLVSCDVIESPEIREVSDHNPLMAVVDV
jgi:exonuclease III